MSTDVTMARPPVVPLAPRTIEASGLSFDTLLQLIVKILHLAGEQRGSDLATRLGLPFSVIEPVLQHLRSTYLCDVSGGGLVGGPSFTFRITEGGRSRAMLYLEQSRYVGAAPVPFRQYEQYMRRFDATVERVVTRARVQQGFAHLVLSDRVLDQLGPAVNSGHSLFVYGPPGNGKTVIAQGIKNLLDGDIAIPHAVDFEGHLLQVHDPVIHETRDVPASSDLDAGDGADGRWLRCRRPLVTVGGELVMSSLELAFDPTSGTYRAPIQLAANGGVLVIDDFGRQRCSVVELLNRWITPLESRTDYLTLTSGQKLPMPFVVLVVLATNIKPADLVDEAFLRRIRYKVFAENPTVADFKLIFQRCCRERELAYDERLADTLITSYFRRRGIPLRGCHPRDLIEHAMSLADYLGEPAVLTERLLLRACDSYFLDEQSATTLPD
ncbi:MAG: ATP-binding protein [Acidobacteria bacterium]|nr:ATP-binding protein [Acidobacteriota bacterium]